MISNMLTANSFLTALACSLLFGVASGAAGTFVAIKKETLSVNIVAVSSFLGLLVGQAFFGKYFYEASILLTVLITLVALSLLGLLRYSGSIPKQTAMLAILATLLGVAFTIFTFLQRNNFNVADVERLFFGNSANLLPHEAFYIIIASLLFFIIFLLFFNKFKIVLFDPAYAKSIGLKAGAYNFIFNISWGLLIFTGVQITGIFLAGAIFILPAVGAKFLKCSFVSLVALASIIGGLGGFVGGFAALHLSGVSSGASVLIACFLISSAFYIIGLYKKNAGTAK